MKCPRTFLIEIVEGNKFADANGIKLAGAECIKEECGGWDKTQRCCGELSGTKALWTLVDVLDDIRDKMPHEKQFRK